MMSLIYAIVSGILISLSFPPFNFSFLSWISLVPILYITRNKKLADTIFLYAATAVIPATACYYSAISFSLAFFVVIILIFQIHFAIFGFIRYHTLKTVDNHWAIIFLIPAIWVAGEKLILIIGLPYNFGLFQAKNLSLIQSASIFGIFGISYLIVLTNITIEEVLGFIKTKNAEFSDKIFPFLPVSLSVLILIANYIYGLTGLSNTVKYEKTVTVSIVQPVITRSQYLYSWIKPENRAFIKKTFDELTDKAIEQHPDIIFWPEGGNGYYNFRIPELRDNLLNKACREKVDLMISSNDIDEKGKKYNSVFSVSNNGELLGRHDKVRLIPEAENNFQAGSGFYPIATSHGPIGVGICFESCFPSIARRLVNNGGEILFFSTSGAIFRKSNMPFIHSLQAVFRAVENRRYVIQAANTGISMIISPRGEIINQSGFFNREVISGNISPLGTKTIYARYGFLFSYISLFLLLIVSAKIALRHLQAEKPKTVRKKKRLSVSGSLGYRSAKNNKAHSYHYKKLIKYGGSIALFFSFLFILVSTSLLTVNMQSGLGLTCREVIQDFFSPADKNVPNGKIAEQFLQAQKNTCGPSALAYLMSFYGRDTLETEVVDSVIMNEEGTSMYALVNAAEQFGFSAHGVKQNYAALKQEPKPVIAYINNNHFVVVMNAASDHVEIFDPAVGHLKIPRKTFESVWNGLIMIVRVKPLNIEGVKHLKTAWKTGDIVDKLYTLKIL